MWRATPMTTDCEDGCELNLVDMLACHGDDACVQTGRNLDWTGYMVGLDGADSDILHSTAAGGADVDVARRWNVSSPAVTQRKRRLGRTLMEKSGGWIMRDAVTEPLWASSLRAYKQTAASRSMSYQM